MPGKKLAILLLIILAGAVNMPAQTDSPKELLSIASDYACFREESLCRLEVYYSLSSKELALTQAESLIGEAGKNYAVVLANLDLLDAIGYPVDSLSKTIAFRVSKTDTTNELSDVLNLLVKPGTYQARLKLVDLQTGRTGYDTVAITVKDLLSPGLKLSSIQLARFIREVKGIDSTSHYRKAGRQIAPNPANSYTLDDPRLYYYAEIYNLAPIGQDSRNFELQYAIMGSQDETLKVSGFHKYRREETPSATGSIDLSSLPPNEYSLAITVRDPSDGQTATEVKSFWLCPPSSRPPVAEEELELFPKVTYYLLTKEGKTVYESSNRTGRLNFIYEYWNRHDPTPGTPKNEFKEQAYGRYQYVVDFYSRTPSSKDGWQTDRGRVYMLYGQPSNTESYPASASNLPWEKWDYNRIAGGRQAYFIFADLRGLGVYQLVHSSAPGEKQNPNWEEAVNQNILRH